MNVSAVTNFVNRVGVVITRNAPKILAVVGSAGVVTGCVLIGVKSTKAPKIVEQHKVEAEKARNEEDNKKALVKVYGKTTLEFAKLYAVPVAVETVSLACLLGSNRILSKRNATILAAFTGLSETFKEYRSRVIEEQGKDKDLEYRFGKPEAKKESAEGKKDEGETEEKPVVPTYDPSQYARFFDPASRYWSKTPEYNLIFLKGVQKEMNDRLKIRGYVFLNEVYEALDIPCSQVGHMVGWIRDSKDGDGHIDFGIYDALNERKRAFVNGDEGSILLDFNVDGIIYDKIKVWREV